MRFRNLHREKGDALVAAIIAAFLFHVAAYAAMEWARTVRESRYYATEAMGLLHMQRALTQYAMANKAAFKLGNEIMFVNNQLAPTVDELRTLGFLSANGPEVTAPWGRTFATTLTVKPTGAIEGAVYLTGSIVDKAGNPDRARACGIAKALGRIGICAPPTNPAVLGNLYTQIPNPSGAPGAVGALVSVAP